MTLQHEEPRNTLITLYLVVASFLFFVVVLALYIYFKSVTQDQIHAKIELAPTADLENLRHQETELLGQDIEGGMKNTYQVVDAAKGLYRIPIERAMELEAEGSWRATLPPAGGAQSPAPQPHATATPTP
jgi:hypothetical protein